MVLRTFRSDCEQWVHRTSTR